MENLQSLLERIGFNHHESAVYLELLRNPDQPASRVATVTHTPRSTIRSILDVLCARGVVGKVFKGNTQYYFCLPTDALAHSVEQDVERHEQRLSLIRESLPLFAAARGETAALPKVQYFEGEKGIIEAFNHSLFVDDISEILFFTSYAFLRSPLVAKNDYDFYVPLRVKKKIPLRALTELNPEALAFLKTSKEQMREHRFLPPDIAPPGTLQIYGNFVAYFSTQERENFAVLIESPSMAATMRLMFELLWKGNR